MAGEASPASSVPRTAAMTYAILVCCAWQIEPRPSRNPSGCSCMLGHHVCLPVVSTLQHAAAEAVTQQHTTLKMPCSMLCLRAAEHPGQPCWRHTHGALVCLGHVPRKEHAQAAYELHPMILLLCSECIAYLENLGCPAALQTAALCSRRMLDDVLP